METEPKTLPPALALLSSERPRNLSWFQSAGMLFGDWGTSRLYVLGLAFLVAGRTSFYLISAMSLLILAVGWAYTQICRIYPDGGGVYSASRKRSATLSVVAALLLIADYTVTASLSALEAFHYFGLGQQHSAQVQMEAKDPGSEIVLHMEKKGEGGEAKGVESGMGLRSPGLWAIVAIVLIGLLNQLGPKHSSGFAMVAAAAMVFITLMICGFAMPAVDWKNLDLGNPRQSPILTWQAFVGIVLALSGVEAIANLTGVMKKPVFGTSKKAIYTVAAEVALFNVILAIAMVSMASLSRTEHTEDMMAFLTGHYVGAWAETLVRIVGGVLLLSATNTAINGIMSILYVLSRDGEIPLVFQKLNAFGAPWIAGIVATMIPGMVLLFVHDLVTLAHLYAIGIVGAVAIDCNLCAIHPRLRKWHRKIPMGILGILLAAIWVTLATTKVPAVIFVTAVMAAGLTLRAITRHLAKKRGKPSLLQQAIMEQLTPDALTRPRILLATAGSARLADAAMARCRERNATLVVCFVRPVTLSFANGRRMTLDTDPAAWAMYSDFLEKGHANGVAILPVYDIGPNGAELIAEAAAMNGVERVLIGSSRRGALHYLIKGSFQKSLEAILPPEIPVEVVQVEDEKR